MSKMGQNTTSGTKPVEPANLQKEAPETDAQPEASTALVKDTKWEQEMLTLREELADEQKQRTEECFRKSQLNNDQRKEEREKLLQEKDIFLTFGEDPIFPEFSENHPDVVCVLLHLEEKTRMSSR